MDHHKFFCISFYSNLESFRQMGKLKMLWLKHKQLLGLYQILASYYTLFFFFVRASPALIPYQVEAIFIKILEESTP